MGPDGVGEVAGALMIDNCDTLGYDPSPDYDQGHPSGVVAPRIGLTSPVMCVWQKCYGLRRPRAPQPIDAYTPNNNVERSQLSQRAMFMGRGVAQIAHLWNVRLRAPVAAAKRKTSAAARVSGQRPHE
jgi:hypothetical protein